MDRHITAAQDGARAWVRQAAALSMRGAAWASPRAMLAGLCASALLPIALSGADPTMLGPGLAAALAGLNVLGSMGGNILADVVSASVTAARDRTRRHAGGSAGSSLGSDRDQETVAPTTGDRGGADALGVVLAEQVREELAARIETVLLAQDQWAQALAATLDQLLAQINASSVVVTEAVAVGQERLLRELMAAFTGLGDQVAGFGPLLRDLNGSVVQVQQTLSRQDAEHRFDRSQTQWLIALLLEFHEELAVRAIDPPSAETPDEPGTTNRETSSATWAGRCPYQGLAPYGPAHAGVFFGRAQATARLLTMVATHRGRGLVIVTGASGAGKSSLLHAGLLPEMRSAAPRSLAATYTTTNWPQITFTPGARPLQELAVQLAARCNADPDQVLAELRVDPARAVLRRAGQVLAAEQIRRSVTARDTRPPAGTAEDHGRMIVVVDQFEELFSLAPAGRREHSGPPGEPERPVDVAGASHSDEVEAFLAALQALATHPSPFETAPNGSEGDGRATYGIPRQSDLLAWGVGAAVVVVVRGDFVDRCSAYPLLARALEERAFVLAPMSEPELRRAITGPAAAAGLRVQAGLAEQIIDDLVSQVRSGADGWTAGPGSPASAGTLPLLSMAMVRIWDQRDGFWLTHAGYDRAGGVASAVTDTAEDTYARLDQQQRQIARHILLMLTVTGADGQVSRRRVALDKLTALTAPPSSPTDRYTQRIQHIEHDGQAGRARRVLQVVEAFTSARLMTTTSPTAAGAPIAPGPLLETGSTARTGADETGPRPASPAHSAPSSPARASKPVDDVRENDIVATIELAHDVLLTAWPRLLAWLAESRAERVLHDQIELDAEEWERRARNPAFLYRGLRLDEARNATTRWRARPVRHPTLGLSGTAQAFLASSTRTAARTRRLRQAAAGILAGLLVIAVITAVVAVRFGRDADQQRTVVLARNAQLVSRQTATYSQALADDPITSARLAAAAWSIAQTSDARIAMIMLLSHPALATLTTTADAVSSVAFNVDGTQLAAASEDGTVAIWDVATGKQLGKPLKGHPDLVNAVTLSSAGRRLATADNDGTVRIWDVGTGKQVGPPLKGSTEQTIALTEPRRVSWRP